MTAKESCHFDHFQVFTCEQVAMGTLGAFNQTKLSELQRESDFSIC